MFKGTFKHSLDAKGRIAIPNRLRQQLEKIDDKEVLIITQGFEDCLLAYPPQEWEKMEQKAGQLALLDDAARDFIRLYIGPATECCLDKMGRVMIPGNLRDYAGIKKEVLIFGAVEKIEIWAKENYDNYINEFRSSKNERIKKMKDIGL